MHRGQNSKVYSTWEEFQCLMSLSNVAIFQIHMVLTVIVMEAGLDLLWWNWKRCFFMSFFVVKKWSRLCQTAVPSSMEILATIFERNPNNAQFKKGLLTLPLQRNAHSWVNNLWAKEFDFDFLHQTLFGRWFYPLYIHLRLTSTTIVFEANSD